jgi:hypothetical protein
MEPTLMPDASATAGAVVGSFAKKISDLKFWPASPPDTAPRVFCQFEVHAIIVPLRLLWTLGLYQNEVAPPVSPFTSLM